MKLININYSDFSGGSAIACSRLHEAFLKNKKIFNNEKIS